MLISIKKALPFSSYLAFLFKFIINHVRLFQHEKHKAEKDPEHGHRHKIEEEIGEAVAMGAGGFAFHEHHEKKETKKEEKEAHGKKQHHLF